MATTEQRSGFRLPWASDARPAAPADQTPTSDDAAPAPEASATSEAVTMQETPMNGAEPAWPEVDRLTYATAAEATATADTGDAGTAEPAVGLAEGDAPATVEVDAPVASTTATPASTTTPAPSTRRANPLVANLVRAMRDAATAAREEADARFAEEAKGRIERIHSQAADEATDLRGRADTDIVGIKDWSKAEMTRVREETDRRIADRKARLETEVEDHAARVERRIDRVQAAVADFQHRMDEFFEILLSEEDPAHLATLAEQLPEPPALDDETLDEPTFPIGVLDARVAAEAEAEALAEFDPSLVGDDDSTPTTDSDYEIPVIAEEDVVRRLDVFTAVDAATEPATTQLSVVGLVSVASIAGFKRALAKAAGVKAVNVASGPNGDFRFTVVHDPDADVRSAIPALPGFNAAITGDVDGVVTVTATDPDGAH